MNCVGCVCRQGPPAPLPPPPPGPGPAPDGLLASQRAASVVDVFIGVIAAVVPLALGLICYRRRHALLRRPAWCIWHKYTFKAARPARLLRSLPPQEAEPVLVVTFRGNPEEDAAADADVALLTLESAYDPPQESILVGTALYEADPPADDGGDDDDRG